MINIFWYFLTDWQQKLILYKAQAWACGFCVGQMSTETLRKIESIERTINCILLIAVDFFFKFRNCRFVFSMHRTMCKIQLKCTYFVVVIVQIVSVCAPRKFACVNRSVLWPHANAEFLSLLLMMILNDLKKKGWTLTFGLGSCQIR